MFEICVRDDIRLIFDKAEYEIAKNYTWRARYLKNGKCIILATVNKHRYSVKQLIFKLHKDIYISHKNGNPYDFRRSQIDIITKVEFFHKKKYGAKKTSKYKNVFYDVRMSKWGTSVVKDKAHFSGRYPTQEDAAIAADKLIVKLYGGNAERNFPQMSLDELEKKYAELEAKYGKNEKEKRAKSVQGVSVKKTPKTSKYVGVYYGKKRKKWIAEIGYLKKRYRLGYFDKEEDAARAYDEKALELYGKGARLNLSDR